MGYRVPHRGFERSIDIVSQTVSVNKKTVYGQQLNDVEREQLEWKNMFL